MLKQPRVIMTIASLALLATTGLQAQSRNLELQTDQELLNVPLDDAFGVRILSDGDISATATPEFSCQQGASCDDVEVSMAGTNGALIVSPHDSRAGQQRSGDLGFARRMGMQRHRPARYLMEYQ